MHISILVIAVIILSSDMDKHHVAIMPMLTSELSCSRYHSQWHEMIRFGF